MCTPVAPGGRPLGRPRPARLYSMTTVILRFVRETEGQDLIEYALLAATISLGVTAAMMLVREQLNSKFSSIGNSITSRPS
jgi:Flp pilus assembly pilin Flp